MTHGSVRAYALTTAGLAIATLVLMNALGVAVPGAAAGIAMAWVIQVSAFRLLGASLGPGMDASRAWVVGIMARFGGLIVAGGTAVLGLAPAGVPISYGIAMLAMLLLEAGWLAVGPTRLAAKHEEPRHNAVRTRSTTGIPTG